MQKGPVNTGPFSQTTLLLNGVLERLSSAELWRAGSSDLDSLASARVAAGASWASLGAEDAETCDGNFVAGLEAVNDGGDNGLDCAVCVSLGAAKNLLDLIYDVCLVHRVLRGSD